MIVVVGSVSGRLTAPNGRGRVGRSRGHAGVNLWSVDDDGGRLRRRGGRANGRAGRLGPAWSWPVELGEDERGGSGRGVHGCSLRCPLAALRWLLGAFGQRSPGGDPLGPHSARAGRPSPERSLSLRAIADRQTGCSSVLVATTALVVDDGGQPGRKRRCWSCPSCGDRSMTRSRRTWQRRGWANRPGCNRR